MLSITNILRYLLATVILLAIGIIILFCFKAVVESEWIFDTIIFSAIAILMLLMGYLTCIVLLKDQSDDHILETAPVDSEEFHAAALLHIKNRTQSQTIAACFLMVLLAAFFAIRTIWSDHDPAIKFTNPFSIFMVLVIVVKTYFYMRKIKEGIRLVEELPMPERTAELGRLAGFLKCDSMTKLIKKRCIEE